MSRRQIDYREGGSFNEGSSKSNGLSAGKETKVNGHLKDKSKEGAREACNGHVEKKSLKVQKCLRSSSASPVSLLHLEYLQGGLQARELQMFRRRWSLSQPVLFSDCFVDTDLWNPDNLSLEYGHLKMDLLEQPSGQVLKAQSMEKYWNAFISPFQAGNNNTISATSRHRGGHVSHRLKEWIFLDATDRCFIHPFFLHPSFVHSFFIHPSFFHPSFIHPSFLYPSFFHSSFLHSSFSHPSFIHSSSVHFFRTPHSFILMFLLHHLTQHHSTPITSRPSHHRARSFIKNTPLPTYIPPNSPFNLASKVPDFFVRPDLVTSVHAVCFCRHGNQQHSNKAFASQGLLMTSYDFVNLLVHTGPNLAEQKPPGE